MNPPDGASVIGERACEESLVRKPMDSRLRGNDGNCVCAVIRAKAGRMVSAAPTATPSSIIPAKAGIHQCLSITHAGAPDTPWHRVHAVIPTKAGIHPCLSITHAGAPDTPWHSVHAVIPAKAGIHTALTEYGGLDGLRTPAGGAPPLERIGLLSRTSGPWPG